LNKILLEPLGAASMTLKLSRPSPHFGICGQFPFHSQAAPKPWSVGFGRDEFCAGERQVALARTFFW
jgi:hypothetical protein